MRISLNWLRTLIDISLSPEELGDRLTMAGFEVEEIEDRRTWAEGVVIGRVLVRQPHPNADKLSVCQVDIGQAEPSQIVCGAANVRADIFVPVATVGSFLPKAGDEGLKIKPAKLRGEASNGMICSLAELGLTKESEGIHIFDPDEIGELQPGQDARSVLGLDDVVLDLSSTANRADALSMIGIAREMVAIAGTELKMPQTPEIAAIAGSELTIAISDPQACPAYIATLITGVTIAPSPIWLQRCLQSAGVRPINNVVDVTNYIMLEWGQPLHAFDRDRIRQVTGSQDYLLGVRFGEAGETLKTLDGQDRQTTEQTLLITANDRPIALAGVMGGEATEVFEGTQNLVLEAAIFDTAVVRRSARSQGLRSEASARYERGVNLAELELAQRHAVQMITELAGGQVVLQAIADSRPSTLTRSIELRLDRVNSILGPVEYQGEIVPLGVEEVEQALTKLNCQLVETQTGVWSVTVPPYRYRDLEREIDLIEEVARLHGYNNFCDTLPEKTEPGFLSLEQVILRNLRSALRGSGLTELIHYSLGKPGRDREIVLSNPLFVEYSALRTNLIDELIEAYQYNLEQGNGALNGFEIGHVFGREEEGFVELEFLGGILGGDTSRGRWARGGKAQPMTWFEAKGLLDSVFDRLSFPVEYQPDCRDARLHPGRTASLWLQGDRLGTLGQLHPQLCQTRGLPDEIYVFELDLETIFKHLDTETAIVQPFQPFSTYPASDRDIAFYVSTQTSVMDLERAICKVGGNLLESVELFDEYRGDRVPEGQRSLAFRLVYRASDRTLKDEDIEPIQQKVRDSLVEKFRAELRS
jgi:phenylalanyl-tRNA synthetase beta chain